MIKKASLRRVREHRLGEVEIGCRIYYKRNKIKELRERDRERDRESLCDRERERERERARHCNLKNYYSRPQFAIRATAAISYHRSGVRF